MKTTDSIQFNKNKIISFLFELHFEIGKRITHGLITDSNDCIREIKKELFRVNGDVFIIKGYDALNNLADQIFYYYYDSDNIQFPLTISVNELSKLN
jgi:hypothetical protein